MVKVSNLRTISSGEWTRVICDIDFSDKGKEIFNQNQIWFEVKNENRHFLASDSYNAFILVPLYLAMYLGEDLKIVGRVSKKLYRNTIHYVQQILCNFSDDLKKVNVFIDGFCENTTKIPGGG